RPCYTFTPCSLQTCVMNLTAPPTVSTDNAASSSMLIPNSSSNAATSSTDCTLSAPRSNAKWFSGLISATSTPSTRLVTDLTRSSTVAIQLAPYDLPKIPGNTCIAQASTPVTFSYCDGRA